MLTKTKFVLSALLVAGFAQTALANQAIEAKIGDRYPLLEQRPVAQPNGLFAFASAAPRGFATEQASSDRFPGVNAGSY